ncbi:hypothetical protein K439DRAFT_1632058, partial [Ramaria rubella]
MRLRDGALRFTLVWNEDAMALSQWCIPTNHITSPSASKSIVYRRPAMNSCRASHRSQSPWPHRLGPTCCHHHLYPGLSMTTDNEPWGLCGV